ncbi:MAG TPA: ABC transporter permease [Gemmatimonadaceae bacterium]|nr:ABC transporter permease [Gemmatimonadaceae bacterium]
MTLPELRSTSTFPLPQRAGIRIFRRFGRAGVGVFREIGLRVFFLRDTLRGLSDPATYLPLTMRQMRGIGVDSIPLVVIVAGFIGAVVAVQSYYQLFAGVQRSVLGLIVRQMIVLELGPLLTGLVLTGRVGARMTAEIGTMRVTEQIDALETLAYDPVAYLVVPRVLAALVMLPVLTVLANAVGLGSAFLVSVLATEVRANEFTEGLRFGFDTFQIVYSLIKATFFGVAIAFFCTYEGYTTGAGAEGVGRSTAAAVVISSVAILVLDALTALLLARYLQG